jgi:hypothetical protein
VSRPPYVTYLRVLLPVDELPAHERRRWTAYAATAPDRRQIAARQLTESVRRMAGRPPVTLPPVESTDAVVLQVDGRYYVSPEQPRLRAWHGLRPDAERPMRAVPAPGLPVEVQGVGVPETVREQAAADLAAYVERGGDVRLFSRTSTWHVPLAWFVLFSPQERQLQLPAGSGRSGPDVGGERSLRYLTSMSSARRRCAMALRTARRTMDEVPIVEDIERIGRWLVEFHPHCLVELDYAGLVDLLDDLHLSGDDSVADVAAGLEALAEGDAATAAAAYRRLGNRWSRVALMSRSS